MPAFAKLKAKLHKDLENPLISSEDRTRTEKQLASIEQQSKVCRRGNRSKHERVLQSELTVRPRRT